MKLLAFEPILPRSWRDNGSPTYLWSMKLRIFSLEGSHCVWVFVSERICIRALEGHCIGSEVELHGSYAWQSSWRECVENTGFLASLQICWIRISGKRRPEICSLKSFPGTSDEIRIQTCTWKLQNKMTLKVSFCSESYWWHKMSAPPWGPLESFQLEF